MKQSKFVAGALAIFTGLILSQSASAENIIYSYDDAGRLTGVYYPNGRSIQYFYDGAGNLLRQLRSTFVDGDGDGMDDAWETLHFSTQTRDGTGDFDNDGVSDLHEFMAGTNPNNASSLLEITQSTSSGGASFTIEWASVAGKAYRVQYTDSVGPTDWKNLGGDVTATGSTTSKTDPNVAQGTKRFYRVIALF